MFKIDPTFHLLLCTAFVLGAWAYFTFLYGAPAGDALARIMFAAGIGALFIALALAFARREREAFAETLWVSTFVAIMVATLAATVGRNAEELKGAGTLVAAVGASLGALRYLSDKAEARRRDERAERLRRHDRMMAEWTLFVANAQLVQAIRILEYEESELLQLAHNVPLEAYRNWKNGIDQILEFLLRLAFAVKAGELDEEAVREAAGWYFRRVETNTALREYCERQGYDLIVQFAQRHGPARAR
jgi:hypothetical protein